ncbi:MAG TPA: FG-GAP repeat protein [Acidimicrobiia bacterium]
MGDPREDVGSAVDAGVVYVFPPNDSVNGLTSAGSIAITEATLHVTPHSGDEFGASVLQADTNGDGNPDLIVGAPGRNSGSGAVYVIRATSDGTSFDFAHRHVIEQGFDGISGSSEAGDHFGASLEVGHTDMVPWFAIGVPDEDVGATDDAGDVVVMPLDLGPGSVTLYAGHCAPGTPQAGDHFGAAMSPLLYSLAVGLPGHNVGAAAGAGQVDLLGPKGPPGHGGFPCGGTEQVIVQGSGGVPDSPGAGNAFGSALTEGTGGNLVIGAPMEDVGNAVDAGTVTVLPLEGAGQFREFTPGVFMPGRRQSYAHFGAALYGPGNLSFFAGAPGADVGAAKAAGQVYAFELNTGTLGYDGADTTLLDESSLHQGISAGDGFGAVIGVGLGHGPAFGIPHKQIGSVPDAGEVAFSNGFTPGQSMIVQRFVQGRDGVPGTAEHGDEMGRALPPD